jgi:hypothetical protein
MATSKKKPGTEVAVREQTTAVALPSYLDAYQGPTGTEGIESADVTIPRIKIAQGTNEEVKEGLFDEGTQFLNIDKSVLAEPGNALNGAPVARFKEYILWRPRKDNGGGILARAKPELQKDGTVRYAWDHPGETFKVKVEGKIEVEWSTQNYIDEDGLDQWGSEIPGDKSSGIAATAHHNYILVLPQFGDMLAAYSFSRSQAKKAKDFNAVLKLGRIPMWARQFAFTTIDEKNDQGTFKNIKITAAGFVDESQFARYTEIAKAFAGKTITVDQSNDAGEVEHDGRL